MMPPGLKIFRELESQVAAEKGDFVLFALCLPEDAHDWDLIVSAPWTAGDTYAPVVSYFVDFIKSRFGAHHLIQLNRIVVADPQDPGVQAINEEVPVEHGAVEVRDAVFFGLPIKRAFIITSKRPATPAVA